MRISAVSQSHSDSITRQRAVVNTENAVWTGGIIPYEISQELSKSLLVYFLNNDLFNDWTCKQNSKQCRCRYECTFNLTVLESAPDLLLCCNVTANSY